MRINKSSLAFAVLTSTIFCTLPAKAFVNVSVSGDSSTYNPGTGYNYKASTVDLNMLDGVSIGVTSGISVDNNNGVSGSGFSNARLFFNGGGTVQGSIGTTNGISLLEINEDRIANKTVTITGSVVNLNTIQVDDDTTGLPANGSTLTLNNAAMVVNATSRIIPLTSGEDTLNIQSAQSITTVAGIGVPGQTFNLIKVGATGNTTINSGIYATTTQFQANNTLSIGDGYNIIGAVSAVAANTGTLQLLGTNIISGTITNLATVNVSGGAGKVVTFGSDVTATNVRFATPATATTVIDLPTGVDINGNLDNFGATSTGIVLFEGDSIISGKVGATSAIGTFQLQGAGNTVEVQDSATVNNVIFQTTATSATTLHLVKSISLGVIDNQTANADVGTVIIGGGGQVTGTVGATKTIHEIDLDGANSIVNFSGNMNLGTGGLFFTNNANLSTTAQMLNNITINGNVDTAVAGRGNVNFLDNDVMNGTIGATNALNSVAALGAGSTVTLKGNVKANTLTFSGSANSATTFDLVDNVNITANVNALSNNIGNLLFEGTSTVSGTIGTPNKLNTLSIQGGAGKTVTLQGNTVNAGSINFAGNAVAGTKLVFPNSVSLSGNIDNKTAAADVGTISFAGANNTVNGTIGATKSVHEIDVTAAGGTLNLVNNVNLGTGGLVFTNTASSTTKANLSDGVNFTANVSAQSPNIGTLNLLGGGNVSGTIGSGVNPLAALNIDTLQSGNKTATFQNTINVADITINGASDIVNFQKSVTGNLGFKPTSTANTTVNFSDGANMNGAIDNTVAAGVGTLNFLGASTVSGTVGAVNSLSAINIAGPNKTVTFQDTVDATNINIQAGGSGAIFEADVTGALAFTNAATNTSFISVFDTVDLNDIGNTTGYVAGQLIFQGGGSVGNVGIPSPLAAVLLNTLGGPKTVIFKGQTINAADIHVASAGPTTINFTNAGPITVLGTMTTVNNGVDIINIQPGAGNATFKQAIGTSANKFLQVNMKNAGKTNTFDGDVNANAIRIQAAGMIVNMGDGASLNGPLTTTNLGTLNFLGDSNINFPIAAPGAQLNAINVAGPLGTTVKLNADIAANNVNVIGGGRLLIGDPTITGNLNVSNGTLGLNPNETLFVTGNVVLNAPTATLEVDMNNNLTSTGQVIANNASTVGAPGKLSILRPGLSPGVSTAIPIVTSTVGAAPSLLTITNPSTFMTTFSEQVIGKTLYLVVTSKSLADVTTQTNTDGVGEALDAIILSGVSLSGSLANIVAQIGNFGDGQSLNYALSTLAPIVDGAIVNESFMAQNNIYDSINDRFDQQHFWKEHHNKKHTSGFSSGDINDKDSGWFRVIRHHANQGERQDIQGYYDDTFGLIAGVDGEVTEDIMLGFALSWSNLDMHDKIVPRLKTAANSYQATVYGSFECGTPWFIDGMASFAYNRYDTQRNIQFGDVDLFPRAEYNGRQFGARALTGYIFDYGTLHAIPMGSLTYGFLGLDGYQETGADTANQIVDSSSFNLLQAGLGGKLLNELDLNGQRLFQLEGHAFVLYDFIGDTMALTSEFTNAGPSFVTSGFTPAKFSFNIGGNASLFSTNDWVFTVNYDLHIKENYTANSGMLRVRHEW